MSEDNKIHVVVAADFSDEIIAELRSVSSDLHIERYFPDVPDHVWEHAEILYTIRHFPRPEQAPNLRWIQLHFAGMDKVINQPIVQAGEVVITSASGIHVRQMANYTLMMMLAFNFQLPQMMEFQRRCEWPQEPYTLFAPEDMERRTVGIAGYGSIGREIARLAHQLGMTVLATKRDVMHPEEESTDYSPEGTGDPEGEIPERIYPGEALATMASACDYLVITVPLTEDTHHMVNREVLQAMKPDAVLINIARGGVVDEEALVDALADGTIRGAALDVFEQEPLPPDHSLWKLDNVIISPHVSGNTSNYHSKAADLFRLNLERYIDNRPLLNPLNQQKGY